MYEVDDTPVCNIKKLEAYIRLVHEAIKTEITLRQLSLMKR